MYILHYFPLYVKTSRKMIPTSYLTIIKYYNLKYICKGAIQDEYQVPEQALKTGVTSNITSFNRKLLATFYRYCSSQLH